jgi:hypothetical protein
VINSRPDPRRDQGIWAGTLRDTVADRPCSGSSLARPNGYGGLRSRWRISESSWAAPIKDGPSLQTELRRHSLGHRRHHAECLGALSRSDNRVLTSLIGIVTPNAPLLLMYNACNYSGRKTEAVRSKAVSTQNLQPKRLSSYLVSSLRHYALGKRAYFPLTWRVSSRYRSCRFKGSA